MRGGTEGMQVIGLIIICRQRLCLTEVIRDMST